VFGTDLIMSTFQVSWHHKCWRYSLGMSVWWDSRLNIVRGHIMILGGWQARGIPLGLGTNVPSCPGTKPR